MKKKYRFFDPFTGEATLNCLKIPDCFIGWNAIIAKN